MKAKKIFMAVCVMIIISVSVIKSKDVPACTHTCDCGTVIGCAEQPCGWTIWQYMACPGGAHIGCEQVCP